MPDPRKKLYEALTNNNFDLGSFEEFNSKMDNPESRKKLYNAATDNNFDLGPYDDFESKISSKKKSQDSGSSSVGQKSASVPKAGSLDGQASTKNSKGFPLIDTNSVAPGYGQQPESKLKNTPKTKISEKKYEEGTMAWNHRKMIENNPDYVSKYEQFKDIQKVSDLKKEEIAKSVNDEFDGIGIWNNIKKFGKETINAITEPTIAGISSIGALFSDEKPSNYVQKAVQKSKIETDSFASEKEKAKKEFDDAIRLAKINKKPIPSFSEADVNNRAIEIKIENKIKSQSETQLKDYLKKDEETGSKDKTKFLTYEAGKYSTIKEKDKLLLEKQNIERNVINGLKGELSDLKKEIQTNGLNEENKNRYLEKYNKYREVIQESLNTHNEYTSNRKELGNSSENLDVFKRDYSSLKSFLGNIDATVSDLSSGALGAIDYGLEAKKKITGQQSPNEINAQMILKGAAKDLKSDSEKIRAEIMKPISVDDINNLSDLGDWFFQTAVAQQVPIYGLIATGNFGIAGIGGTSLGNKFEDMKSQIDNGEKKYSDSELMLNPIGYGVAETASAMVDRMLLKNAARVISSATNQERQLIVKGFAKRLLDATKNVSGNVAKGAIYEGIDEGLTQGFENIIDGKPFTENMKDPIAAGAVMGAVMPLGAQITSQAIKPFTTDSKIQKSALEVMRLRRELDNSELSDLARQTIQENLNNSQQNLEKLAKQVIGNVESLSKEQFQEIIQGEKTMANIKEKALGIKNDKTINDDLKKQILENLKEEFNSTNQRRIDLLERGHNVLLEQLPEKKVIELKDKAQRELMKEQNPDGTNSVTIDDNQISKRAIQIYNKEIINSEQRALSREEIVIPPHPENYDIVSDNKTQTSSPSSSGEATPSVNQSNNDQITEPNKTGLSPENEVKIPNSNQIKKGQYEYDGKIYNYDGSSLTNESGDMYPLSFEKDSLLEKIKKDGVLIEETKTDTKEFKFSEEEKATVQKKVVEEPRVLLRRGNVGKDAFFALPNEGIYGEVVDKVGADENYSAYQYPEDFKIKDLSNDVVFDDYMSNKMYEQTKEDGYDAAYVMEIDGSKVLHIVNPGKLTLLDEKLPELRNNERTPQPITPTDGNVSTRNNTETAQEQNNKLQPSVKSPTNKGEVTGKLQKINQETFGLDKKQAKANAVVMEKTIETMAQRAGISKEEMFDQINFEKGDAATIEKLTKKGNALFQIIGKNAKLSKEVKQFLNDAKALEKKGANPKDIFIQTGWEKGTDGKWKYDMQEGKVEFKKTDSGKLEDVLDYTELFDKYPDAKGISIVFNSNMDMEGMFDPAKNRIFINPSSGLKEARLTLLHEIQHWIQNKEGFSKGGNTESARKVIENKINEAKSKTEKTVLNKFKALISSKQTNPSEIKETLSRLQEISQKEDFKLYESIAGEVEARNVEGRFDMSAEQRAIIPLSETEDVARDEQIVLFQGEQGAMLAEDGKYIIYALTDPNVSTPLHELAHVYEHYLTESEKATVLKEAGQESWTIETSEFFARGFEKYLADGIAPNPEMKQLFENFKKWLTDIYNGITNSEIDLVISPKMQIIFDEMLGEKPLGKNTIQVGNYSYTYANGEWIVKNKEGDIEKKKDIPKKVLEIHSENFDFTQGETALEKQKINDVSTWEEDVAEHSENPVEVAQALVNLAVYDFQEGLDPVFKAIAEVIGGKGVERKSFVDRIGAKAMKGIKGSIPLQYFAKKGEGKGLDIIAMEAEYSVYGDYDASNPRISEDDVLDFINDNPNGTLDYLNRPRKNKESVLKSVFTDLTGLPASEKFILKAINQAIEKDNFINNFATEKDFLSDDELLSLHNEYEQSIIESNGRTKQKEKTTTGERKEGDSVEISPEGETGPAIQSENGQDGGGQEKGVTTQFLNWLDEMENNLDQFGKENLSSGIPIVVAKATIQAMRIAVKSGMAIADVIQAGLDALKQSDWYKNLSGAEKTQAEIDFMDSFGNPKIDEPSQRQTENLLNRSVSDKISEEDAYEEVKATFEKSRTELDNKKTFKEYATQAYRNFVKRFTDRQYLAKSLLNKSGMKAVQNRIINAHGASGRAKIQFEEAYNKIYKKLTTEDRKRLDEIIQAKRFIAIDENREARGLEPVTHPNFIDKNKSEKFLSKLEKELGAEKYNDLVQRADAYFKTYKGLLKDMLDNGLISQASFDSMSDVDYQPRVFLQFVTDFNGDLETNKRSNNIDTGGLSADQIKSMSEGDASSLVLNSEWLLTNSLLSRSKAMAMNNINKRFMTGEFQAAKKRFDALDPKNLKGDDIRFYKYFKELSSKIIDNPIIGKKESGNPRFKYEKTPANFGKAYYYIDGQRYEFFIENELHESWNDNIGGILSSNAKEFISYASGAALVKAIATGNNPAFPIVNTPRDFMFTTTFSDQYSNIVPKAMIQVAKDVVKSIKEIRKPDSDILKKYIEYGGAMDFLSSQGTLKKESLLGQAIEKMISANTKDVAKSVFSKVTLHKISEYSEMMFRLGIFQRSIKNQLDLLGLKDISEVTDKQQLDDIYNEAVANARSILDFNQGGSVTKDLESVIPYINVAFQGGRVAATAFEKDPVGTSSRVLQVATMASIVPIGMSLALISALKSDDDEEKSSYDIYLNALSGISRYQKMKYINIVTGVKDDEGQYQVIKIAKAQELSPIISVTDDIYNNFIRKIAGKEKKTTSRIIDDAVFTFNSTVMPVDLTSPAGLFTRNPMAKATLTYATGYDFFREEPLSTDIGKVPKQVEGLSNSNVEDFYKKLGTEYGLSPIRSKAFVESFITGPNTNPFVGMLYGGADAAISDKGMKEIGGDLAKSIYKSTGKRLISYTSDFNRQLEANKDLQDKIDKINIEKYKMKVEFNQLAKDFINKDISKDDLKKKLMELDPEDRERMTNKIKDKIRLRDIDGTILDIKYEREPEAKALMIMHYYGDISDGSKESKEILRQMARAKGILTPKVLFEYKKLKEELSKQKTPN